MFTHSVLADVFLKGLYESQALWNKMNRNFDGLVKDATMDSVDIPLNPQLVVSSTAVAGDSVNRKKAKGDTGYVNVPFGLLTIAMTQEEEERMLMNGRLLQNFLADAQNALDDALDAIVIAEAQTTNKVINWAGANLSWTDIINIDAQQNVLKVPKRNRIQVIPASRQTEFQSIDVVKAAMANNRELLEGGVFVINNTQFYISSYVGKIGGKDNIVGISTRGLAVVLKGFMQRQSAYDITTRVTNVDYNTGAATKLLKNEFAVVAKQP